eukprot:5092605-Pyramimonas_sp.AAC.1
MTNHFIEFPEVYKRTHADKIIYRGNTRQHVADPGRFVTRRFGRGAPKEAVPEGALPFGHLRVPQT